MPNKTIFEKTRQADHIARTAIQRAPLVAERLRRALPPGADGEGTDIDPLQVQVGLARNLLATSAALREADNRLRGQRHETRELRTKRKAATHELYEQVTVLRSLLNATHGKNKTLSVLGLEGKTPRVPDTLALAGRQIVHRLLHPDLSLPGTRLMRLPIEPRHVAAELEPLVARLEGLLEAVAHSKADETALLAERDRELERFRKLRTGLAGMFEGLYVAAGLDALVPELRRPGASVLHPVRRRRRRRKTAAHRVPERAVAAAGALHPVNTAPSPSPPPLRLVPGGSADRETAAHRSSGRGHVPIGDEDLVTPSATAPPVPPTASPAPCARASCPPSPSEPPPARSRRGRGSRRSGGRACG
jgi:hypothetical protein